MNQRCLNLQSKVFSFFGSPADLVLRHSFSFAEMRFVAVFGSLNGFYIALTVCPELLLVFNLPMSFQGVLLGIFMSGQM